MGFLASLSPRVIQTGVPPITGMLSDGSTQKGPQGTEKAIREGDDRGDDRNLMGGNCVVTNDRLAPQECSFGLRVQ